jgi:hypothetical protein
MGGIYGLGTQDVWKLHAHKILLEKSEGMTNFGRTMSEGEKKTTFIVTVCEDMNCKAYVSKLAGKLSCCEMNIQVP